MKLTRLLAGLLLLATMTFAWAGENPDSASTAPVLSATNATAQVIAYYFHGTVRCETCLKIEKQVREFIEQRFQQELATNQLVFRPINYDLQENSHFLQDYKLPCPSLVLVWQENGKDVRWQMLGQTWTLVETPASLDQYVEKEVGGCLSELNGRPGAASTTNSLSKAPISESAPGKMVGSLTEINALFGDMNAAFVFVHATNGSSLINWVPMNRAKRTLESDLDINLGLFELKPSPGDYSRLAERLPAFSLPGLLVILRNGTITMLSEEITETNLLRQFSYTLSVGGCCSLGNH